MVLTYVHALHGMAPDYLVKFINPYNSNVMLRYSNKLSLIVRARLKSEGGCTFAVTDPRLWNSLSFSLLRFNFLMDV